MCATCHNILCRYALSISCIVIRSHAQGLDAKTDPVHCFIDLCTDLLSPTHLAVCRCTVRRCECLPRPHGVQHTLHYICFRLRCAGGPAITHATPPSVTISALAALSGVRHCAGLRGEQNSAPLASDTVAERTAVTRPMPSAPSDFCTAPWRAHSGSWVSCLPLGQFARLAAPASAVAVDKQRQGAQT